MMKKLKYILALLAVPVAALSQEIEVEKVGETQLSSLAPNTASVVFVSNLGDLSIKVVKGTEQPQRRQAADGKGYEYEFVVDVSGAPGAESETISTQAGGPEHGMASLTD